jgi:hypothetical protein
MNLINSMAAHLLGKEKEVPPPVDPTVYRIETATHKYCGRIVYQDDMVMKIKISKPKAIKILKANIERITRVESEVVQQYFQWHKAQEQLGKSRFNKFFTA